MGLQVSCFRDLLETEEITILTPNGLRIQKTLLLPEDVGAEIQRMCIQEVDPGQIINTFPEEEEERVLAYVKETQALITQIENYYDEFSLSSEQTFRIFSYVPSKFFSKVISNFEEKAQLTEKHKKLIRCLFDKRLEPDEYISEFELERTRHFGQQYHKELVFNTLEPGEISGITSMFEAGMEEGFVLSYYENRNPVVIRQLLDKLQAPSSKTPALVSRFLRTHNELNIYYLPSALELKASDETPKTLLLLGQTGSGKTKLINSLANWLMSVEFYDNFRYELIDESKISAKKKQGESQTEEVSDYYLLGENQKWRIIDTPGFADTRGIIHDLEITKKIINYFKNEIKSLDFILFVVKSSETRLSDQARWVYSKMQEFFGKDLEKRIILMATFGDMDAPICKETLRNADVRFEKTFSINSSNIFANPFEKVGIPKHHLTKSLYKMSIENLSNFFDFTRSSVPVSTHLTNCVIRTREYIENIVASSQERKEIGLQKVESLRKLLIEIANLNDIIGHSKDFEVVTEESTYRRKDISGQGIHTTTCLSCNYTCHDNCNYANDQDKIHCTAMENGYCKACFGHCIWTLHSNVPYILEMVTIKVCKTLESLKEQYYTATSDLSLKHQLLQGIIRELKVLIASVLHDMDAIREGLAELEEKAMKVSNPLETLPYVTNLIQMEEITKKNGWEVRVGQLIKIMKRLEHLKDVYNQREVKLFENFRPIFEEKLDDLYQQITTNTTLDLKDPSSCNIF